jgi:branched-chain amino acid transport system ATP-binding protein
MDGDALMTVEGLNVSYGDFRALHDINMSFQRGLIISIIGSNGAGKSTLLNAIMGVNRKDSGKVAFDGEDITGLRTSDIVAKGVTMSPEGSSVFEDMSVHENLLMGAHLTRAKNEREQMLERAYELFPALKEKSKQLASFLSGGQRQMLAIARALMSGPKLLICDELSLGLAPVIVNDIYNRILDVNGEGVTVVLVEQEVKRSLEFSDYSYVLVKGRVVMEGMANKLSEDEVKDAYFGINKYA